MGSYKNLHDILSKNSYQCVVGHDIITITGLSYDSRAVCPGNVFFAVSEKCYKDVDMTYIKEALAKGAKAFIWETSSQSDFAYCLIWEKLISMCSERECTLVLVKEVRVCMALAASIYYDEPHKKMITIGITGTKGKSTTAGMIHQVLNKCNIPCGLIGTNGAYYADKKEKLINTTPESVEIYRLLSGMVGKNIKVVVMEVSSQGLKMNRVKGICFDYAVFTNLGIDHIGGREHKDLDEYFRCKQMLFMSCKEAWFNKDDANAYKMAKGCVGTVHYYSVNQEADCYVTDMNHTFFTTRGLVEEVFELRIPGRYNIYNALAAISVLQAFHLPIQEEKKALAEVVIDGRMEKIALPHHAAIIIDYAHNAASLEALLSTLREYAPKRLVSIFGCGGNRSKDRRLLMGEVSGRCADFTIITSDNPREERPEDIIADIEIGIHRTGGKYICIPDRRQAVAYAVQHVEEGDIIALAGKGHEDYQEINGVRYPMLDRQLVYEAMGKQR